MHDVCTYRTHLQSRRLQGYDYARPAAYFITACTHGRRCLFGEVVGGRMRLSDLGRIVEAEWRRSEAVRAEVVLDAFVVMPNHIHGIVVLVPPDVDRDDARDPRGYRVDGRLYADGDVASTGRSTLPVPQQPGPPPRSLGAFMAGFKSAATRGINRQRGTPGEPVWQRNYFDRILRDEREWQACRRYIDENPMRWTEDRLNRRQGKACLRTCVKP